MAGKKKTMADGKTPAKGRPGHKGKAAPTAALIPVATEAPLAPVSHVTETVPICDVCRDSMTAPFSQCSLMRHIACGVCGVGGECRPCADMGVAAVYVQSPYLDSQFGGIKVPCPYKKFGCGSSVACRDVRAHQETCAWMPCSCPICGVEFSPAEFLSHLTDKASERHVSNITYGTDVPFAINVDIGSFLLVAEEDCGVFLVVVDEAAAVDGSRAVDVVCIRTVNTEGRVYSSSVAVEGPLPKGLRLELKKKVIQSSLSVSDLTVDSDVNISSASACDLLWVFPEMLHGEEEIHLCVRIDKV